MKNQIENALSKVADTARNTVNTAVDATQNRVSKAGKVISQGKKPVAKMSKASLDTNAITFRMSKELIELQTKSVQDTLDAIAKRLREASRADTVRELLAQQRDVLPGAARFYMNDIKDAFGIVRGAASDFGSVVTGLNGSSVKKTVKKKAKATEKTAKKVARKVSRKTPVRKAKNKTKAAANQVAKTVTEARQTA